MVGLFALVLLVRRSQLLPAAITIDVVFRSGRVFRRHKSVFQEQFLSHSVVKGAIANRRDSVVVGAIEVKIHAEVNQRRVFFDEVCEMPREYGDGWDLFSVQRRL